FALGLLLEVPEQIVGSIALFGAIYAVGAWEPDRRRAALSRALVVGGMGVLLVVALYRASVRPAEELGLGTEVAEGPFSPYVSYALLQIIVNTLFFAGAWWFGDHAWAAARGRAREALRAEQLPAERAVVAAQAVTIERIRLARELHDVVAHHVSTMGVAAAAARTQLDRDPAKAGQALRSVEAGAREALAELHGLLRTLRDEGGPAQATERDPAVGLGLDRLDDLVAESVAAGVPTGLVRVGEPVAVPATIGLNLYRIAQEALTNVRKHAGPGARAQVRLRWLADEIELEVSDDGGGAAVARSVGRPGGLGLVGMAERAETDGGTLEAGPRRGGGFVVRARIPLRAGSGR
ncbi:MAG TPA: histidine kinase, partial [Actinotalea sp.]|nr:histidine kinase [Actinotalea sp.]